ncbi:uncharacterized protein LOC112271850 [Brachypodium distachyon]|nr:uncharacterized protein LOC112271850 [Brachypodium distachyon]|eukprot:XP_024317813.1 uncharacterized protein LOC112271850 [Brachypodium distachyon]
MARTAVNRSAGRCESFRGRADGYFLLYLADRAPLLRSLHLTSRFDMMSHLGGDKLVAAMAKLRLLERLVLSEGNVDVPSLLDLLEEEDHCPRLELLDASGCHFFGPAEYMERARLAGSRIKDLRLPLRGVRFASGVIACRRRPARDQRH